MFRSRTRTPADLLLLASSLVAGPALVVTVIVVAISSGNACATESTTAAPDGGIPKCQTGPHLFCQEAAPDAPACNTNDSTSPFLASAPRGVRYTVGCVVNVVGERDQQGDCTIEGVCKCLVSEVPSDAAISTPVSGDAAIPPPAPAPSAPIWDCSSP